GYTPRPSGFAAGAAGLPSAGRADVDAADADLQRSSRRPGLTLHAAESGAVMTASTCTAILRTHLVPAMAVVAVFVLATPDAAHAQSARARLSQDLSQRLDSGNTDAASVIISGSQQKIDRLAARHRLTVDKRLSTGAVRGAQ